MKKGKLQKLKKSQDEFKKLLNPFNLQAREDYKKDVSNAIQYNNLVAVEYDHFKVKEITHLNNYIDPVASKTIYALHLIDGDNTEDAPGVDCELTVYIFLKQKCPFVVEISRLDNIAEHDIYDLEDVTFFMHVMIQYWSA
jgi:HSP90 family molecular chaperone